MDTKPAITFINRTYPPVEGATGRVLAEAAWGFARAGWAVTVVATGPRSGEADERGVRIVRGAAPPAPSGPLGYMRAWWALRRAASRATRGAHRPDIVVSMTDPPLTAAIGDAIARRRKAKHIHWCQDVYPDLFEALDYPLPAPAPALIRALTRRALARADRVVAIGRCMARRLMAAGVERGRITVIPNWPDVALSPRRAAPDNDPVSESLRRAGPRFRVLYAGNIGRAHEITPILGAARILSQSHPEVEFVFVGQGRGFEDLARARAEAGLENIRLLPRQPDSHLRALMESGDVHLVSLRPEAAGLCVPSKAYSAFAAGRPCLFVGPMRSEVARVLTDFSAGAVVEVGGRAAEELAAQIVRYRQDPEAWFAAQQGAQRAGRAFTPRASIRAFIDRAQGLIEDAK